MNTGGPAFPMAPVGTGDPRDGMAGGSEGMSLRDWFAGQALDGLMSQDDDRSFTGVQSDAEAVEAWRRKLALWDARQCYRYADAMLLARTEKEGA